MREVAGAGATSASRRKPRSSVREIIVAATQARFAQPLSIIITLRRQTVVNDIVARVMRAPVTVKPARAGMALPPAHAPAHRAAGAGAGALFRHLSIRRRLRRRRRWWIFWNIPSSANGSTRGSPIWSTTCCPNPLWSNLFVGEYGIFTLGLTYAVAIVLPVVGLFFFVFAILEDSGYLPRLAMLIDRLFKGIGLNGRAVIPLVLGFGCDTMATMVTRVLETKRERIITTLLLALAIPCAAQSGLFLAMLGAVQPYGLLIYLVILCLIFLVVGLSGGEAAARTARAFLYRAAAVAPAAAGQRAGKDLQPAGMVFLRNRAHVHAGQRDALARFAGLDTGMRSSSARITACFGMLERALDPLAALIGLPTSGGCGSKIRRWNSPAARFCSPAFSAAISAPPGSGTCSAPGSSPRCRC